MKLIVICSFSSFLTNTRKCIFEVSSASASITTPLAFTEHPSTIGRLAYGSRSGRFSSVNEAPMVTVSSCNRQKLAPHHKRVSKTLAHQSNDLGKQETDFRPWPSVH